MTSSEKIDFARQVVAAIPDEHCPLLSPIGATIDSLSLWYSAELARETARARDLDAALILSDFFDGDPDEYLGVVPALREHFAQPDDVVDAEVKCGGEPGMDCALDDGHAGLCVPAATVDWTARADTPEPPVGTRLRDKDGGTWQRVGEGSDKPWVGYDHTGRSSWATLQTLGPLHQVWTDHRDIPEGVKYTDKHGETALRGSTVHGRPESINRDYGPFVAVTPYGEVGQ